MSGNLLFWLYTPITLLMPACLCAYLGRRLCGALPGGRASILVSLVAATVLFLFVSLTLIFWGEQDRAPLDGLLEPGYFLLGYLLDASVLLVASDLLKRFLAPGQLRRLLDPLALLGALGLAGLGQKQAHGAVMVQKLDVEVPELPSPFVGYRILQLSDVHLRQGRDRAWLEQLVAQANATKPDLVAITGDVIDGPLEDMRRTVEPLGALRATYGVYLVLGNHEYYADAEAAVAEFRRLGLCVLLDEHRLIRRDGEGLVVAGVTNPRSGMHGSALTTTGALGHLSASPAAALANADAKTRLLLAHQPRSVAEARGLDFTLALSGHGHGGQFFPWNYVVDWVMPYPTGLTREGGRSVYVSRGIGTFGPKQRLGSPAEMTLFVLTRQR